MGKSLVFILTILCFVFPSTQHASSFDSTPPETPDNRQKLADFARKTRITRPDSKSTVHITNANLISTSDAPAPKNPLSSTEPGESHETPVDPALTTDVSTKRDYWRNTYLGVKANLEAAEVELEYLDEEIPTLWNEFYSADDPNHRERTVRPQLDAAIARQKSLSLKTEALRANLTSVLVDARADGALPGWFRDIK